MHPLFCVQSVAVGNSRNPAQQFGVHGGKYSDFMLKLFKYNLKISKPSYMERVTHIEHTLKSWDSYSFCAPLSIRIFPPLFIITIVNTIVYPNLHLEDLFPHLYEIWYCKEDWVPSRRQCQVSENEHGVRFSAHELQYKSSVKQFS